MNNKEVVARLKENINLSDIYWFNATCEMAVGNATNSYMPPKHLRLFDDNLAFLPFFFAEDKDVVIIENSPSKEFLNRITILRDRKVQFLTLSQLENKIKSKEISIAKVKPWGWSPVSHKKFATVKQASSSEFKESPHSEWNKEHRDLYSRKTALGVLNFFLSWTDKPDLFLPLEQVPTIGTSLEQVKSTLSSQHKTIIKAPWSSSGRGMIILHPGTFHDTYTNWINGFVKSQGYVMVERALNRIYDLSFHFEVRSNEVLFLGNASFHTEENGQYIGNNIQTFPSPLSPEEKAILSAENISHISEGLREALTQSPIFGQYEGVLGIDVLLYRDEKNNLRFHPCLEINLRYNMGTLALRIKECLHPETEGMWKVHYLGREDAIDFDREMTKKHPIVMTEGKIRYGYLPLIEPNTNKQFAVYLVAE